MHKVVLVDDEKWTLTDISHTFPFSEYGFEIAGQYTNASLALSEVYEIQPDVLFIDIRMPGISGLTFIQMATEQLPNLVSVIISGYSDFSYAREAIKLRVFDYCLKPVEAKSAEALLQRLKEHLENLPTSVIEKESCNEHEYTLSSNKNFSQLLDYVNHHAFEKIRLERLASMFYINANYCGQLFKKETGKSFPEYVRCIRMKRACELLEQTKMPISDIAFHIGYDDFHYFTRLFVSVFNMSPRRYRAIKQSKKESI